MSIEVGLRTLWAAQSSITGAVSGSTAAIFATTADQGTPAPYIVYRVGDTDVQNRLDSSSAQHRTDVVVECYATRVSQAVDLRDAVYEYMKDYTGAAGDQTIHGVLAGKAGLDYEQPTDGSDIGLHIAELTLDIAHQAT